MGAKYKVTTSLDCDECGHAMEGMWEDEYRDFTSSVFHCEWCGADREVLRKRDKEGHLKVIAIRHFFFG